MTAAIRQVAFGDHRHGVWGALLLCQEEGEALLITPKGAGPAMTEAQQLRAATSATQPSAPQLEGSTSATHAPTPTSVRLEEAENDDWIVRGEELELRIESASPPAAPENGGLSASFELCRVTGRVGASANLQLEGVRAVHVGAVRGTHDSLRVVTAWFPDGKAYALSASRPGRAKGQERDVLLASVLEPAQASVVDDPRLSTAYDCDGLPRRAGLELWVESSAEADEDVLHRLAGESAARPFSLDCSELVVLHVPLLCHSGGEEGSGIYCLGRPQ